MLPTVLICRIHLLAIVRTMGARQAEVFRRGEENSWWRASSSHGCAVKSFLRFDASIWYVCTNRGVVKSSLHDVTSRPPSCRHVCSLVQGRERVTQ